MPPPQELNRRPLKVIVLQLDCLYMTNLEFVLLSFNLNEFLLGTSHLVINEKTKIRARNSYRSQPQELNHSIRDKYNIGKGQKLNYQEPIKSKLI